MKPIFRASRQTPLSRRSCALGAVWLLAAASAYGDDARTKPLPNADRTVEGEIARYCGNLAPTAGEARAAYQAHQLSELEGRVRQASLDLERATAEAHDWVNKRQAMMKAATDDVVAVYAKMPADAAATQMAAMEGTMAAAVLAKLSPRAASAILGEMDAEKAARLAAIMAGASGADKS